MNLTDKNNRPLVVGAPVRIKWGNEIVHGKVTDLDLSNSRVAVRDDHKGKGSRGTFTIEASAAEIVTKAKR